MANEKKGTAQGTEKVTETKNGNLVMVRKPIVDEKYHFVGKVSLTMPNMIVTASDKKKPTYKGNTYDLNATAKRQIVDHFYNENGKRNKKSVAYFGIEKTPKQR